MPALGVLKCILLVTNIRPRLCCCVNTQKMFRCASTEKVCITYHVITRVWGAVGQALVDNSDYRHILIHHHTELLHFSLTDHGYTSSSESCLTYFRLIS